jgi:hypothetical protein
MRHYMYIVSTDPNRCEEAVYKAELRAGGSC